VSNSISGLNIAALHTYPAPRRTHL